jgi:hypothetical protein
LSCISAAVDGAHPSQKQTKMGCVKKEKTWETAEYENSSHRYGSIDFPRLWQWRSLPFFDTRESACP